MVYESTAVAESGEPTLRVWEVAGDAFLRLAYADGTEFWIDRPSTTVWATWTERSSLQDTICYLVGPVFGLLLRMRGQVCLHASGVEMNGACVAFAGGEGAGKSTTAASFALSGFPVLSDDILVLVENEYGFQTLPAYPRVNLWPESVKMLYGTESALPHIAEGWGKRFLGLGQENQPKFSNRQLPLRAVYVFGNPSEEANECIVTVPKKDAFVMLVANTYATNFLDAKQRAKEFEVLSRLVAQVPVRKVNARRGLVSIGELCEVIYRDATGIDSSSLSHLL